MEQVLVGAWLNRPVVTAARSMVMVGRLVGGQLAGASVGLVHRCIDLAIGLLPFQAHAAFVRSCRTRHIYQDISDRAFVNGNTSNLN